MSYAQLDVHFDEHPKFADLTMAEFGLMACAIAYCNRLLTDGVITRKALRVFAQGEGPELAKSLVLAGIWEEVQEGHRIVGFLDHNPSRETVLARRATWEEKSRQGGLKSAAKRRASAATVIEPLVQPLVQPLVGGLVQPNGPFGSTTLASTTLASTTLASSNLHYTAQTDQETPKPPSGAPCVLVSDKPESAPTLVPTRDHEPAEWRAGQTTDDGVLGMLDGVYGMGLREGRPSQPVTGIRNRNDASALRKVCLAHALGADGNPLRSQALLDWTRAAAKEFSLTRPDTLTPTVNAFAGWLDRSRKHFDSGPKRHPAEANAPAQPRAFAKTPPRPAPTGNASGILDLIEAEHADCGATAGPRSDFRGRDAPDIDPDEIGTSQGNVDGIAKRVGSTR